MILVADAEVAVRIGLVSAEVRTCLGKKGGDYPLKLFPSFVIRFLDDLCQHDLMPLLLFLLCKEHRFEKAAGVAHGAVPDSLENRMLEDSEGVEGDQVDGVDFQDVLIAVEFDVEFQHAHEAINVTEAAEVAF